MRPLFCRRLRMEIDLASVTVPEPLLPAGYRFLNWSPELQERHAQVKWRSFQGELDGAVFRSLGELSGCRLLMEYIAQHGQFIPEATWLLVREPIDSSVAQDCGTIQGLAISPNWGAIQNVGVAREHRQQGLGRCLVLKSLHGFQAAGIQQVSLEVSAENLAARQLYFALGFRPTKTLFREIER